MKLAVWKTVYFHLQIMDFISDRTFKIKTYYHKFSLLHIHIWMSHTLVERGKEERREEKMGEEGKGGEQRGREKIG